MNLRNQPYLPLYVQDFLTDEKLAECSASATGVYIRLMCLMHKSEYYGKILLKQKYKQTPKQTLKQTPKQTLKQTPKQNIKQTCNQISDFARQLARQLPYSVQEIEDGLCELLQENVIFLEGDFLCQKRMLKDAALSEIRANAGEKGGANSLGRKFAQANLKANLKAKYKANAQANFKANTEIESEYENEIENEIELNNNKEQKLNFSFSEIWELYQKKVGNKNKLEKKWASLKPSEREAVMQYVPKYIASEPNKQYRKNLETFLNNRSWEDELIIKSELAPSTRFMYRNEAQVYTGKIE